MITQINLRVGDKVFYGGKLCEVKRNSDMGYFDIQQVGTNFIYSIIEADVEVLYTRKCSECYEVDVMPDAKNGRCQDCLEIQAERLAI